MADSSSEIDEVRQAFEQARASWPEIHVAFDAFSTRAVGAERAHLDDLYLACALSASDPVALAAFDEQFLSAVSDAVAKIDSSRDFFAEVSRSSASACSSVRTRRS